MTNQPTLFDFYGAGVRVIDIDGDPWFVAKDVAKVLGYNDRDQAIRKHCKAKQSCPVNSTGQVRHITIIPERDVYRLIMRSKLPAAEAFEDWVVGTVLPAIRKDGGYVRGEEKVETGEMSEDELVLSAMTMLKNKVDRLQKHVSDHLEYMTVNEFFALKHIYPSTGDSQSLGRRASTVCRNRGLKKRYQFRYAPSISDTVSIGEYPVEALEEAFEQMRYAGRIPEDLPVNDLGLVH
jgi:prophage antirepressor-like protein